MANRTKRITIRVSEMRYNMMHTIATKNGLTVQDFVRFCVNAYIMDREWNISDDDLSKFNEEKYPKEN